MIPPELPGSNSTATAPDVDLAGEFLPGDLSPRGLVSIGPTR